MWKDIPNYEGIYQASDLGEIKSLARTIEHKNGTVINVKEKLLKPRLVGRKNCQYYEVVLYKDSKSKAFKVHRIIAELFCKKHDGCDVVNHIDNDRLNNIAINLEWTTVDGNNQHRHIQGRSKGAKGSSNGKAKLSDDDVIKIRKMLSDGRTQTYIANKFDIHQSTVYKIKNGLIRS